MVAARMQLVNCLTLVPVISAPIALVTWADWAKEYLRSVVGKGGGEVRRLSST